MSCFCEFCRFYGERKRTKIETMIELNDLRHLKQKQALAGLVLLASLFVSLWSWLSLPSSNVPVGFVPWLSFLDRYVNISSGLHFVVVTSAGHFAWHRSPRSRSLAR